MIKHFLLSLCSVKQDVELLLQPTTFHINTLPVLTNNKIPGSGTVTPQEGTKKKKNLMSADWEHNLAECGSEVDVKWACSEKINI